MQRDHHQRYAAQKRYAAKLRAQGLNPKQFWVRDYEHQAIKEYLAALRNNKAQ